MRTFVALTLVTLCAGHVAAQQVARDGRATPTAVHASIAGTVVAADSGRPIRRANVSLTGGNPKTGRVAQTDEQGAFSFTGLPAGEYVLSAAKGGYIDSIYGQKHPGSGRPGTPIRLVEGQQTARLELPLARGGAISGTVRDETGEPAFGVAVRAMRWVMQSGERALQVARSTTTDDRGAYRLHSLLPGEYLVLTTGQQTSLAFNTSDGVPYSKIILELDTMVAEGAGSIKLRQADGPEPAPPATGFANVFYPGTPHGSAATALTVAAGEEHSSIDIPLQIVPLARVSGTVTGQNVPATASTVQLVDTMQLPGFNARTARTDATGRFVFDGVPPGQYTLITRATPRGAPRLEASAREAVEFYATINEKGRAQVVANSMAAVSPLWASADLVVDGRNLNDIQLILQPGISVSGRIAVEGASQLPANARLVLGLSPIAASKSSAELAMTSPAPVDASGNFTIRGVTPGRYRVSVLGGMPPGFSLLSAIYGGVDVLDVPLEIDGSRDVAGGVVTLTSGTTEVSGVIRDASGQPAAGFTVIAFASEDRFWTPQSRRIQAVRPSTDGRYQFRNLPPGNYRLTAVPDVEPGRWFDPAFLRQLAGFATFTLTAAGQHTQDFQVK